MTHSPVDPVAAAARAHVRTLAHRYSAIVLGAGFLAVVVAFFPSTAPQLSSAGTALTPIASDGGPLISGRSASEGASGTATSSGAGLFSGSFGAPGAGNLDSGGFGSSYPTSNASTGSMGTASTGGLYGTGSNGSSPAPVGGLAPAPIKPASGGSSAPSCPLPPLSIPDAGKVPQAESLLAAVTGLCAVLTTVPALVPELPAILTALPSALQHGTLPGPLDKLVQALAFDVVIPLVSVLPLPSTLPSQFPTESFARTDEVHPSTWPVPAGPGAALWQRDERWAANGTVDLSEPATMPSALVTSLERAASAGAPVTVVLSPAAASSLDQPALTAWLAHTARQIPTGVTTLLAVRSTDGAAPVGPLSSPAQVARELRVLRMALPRGSASGLSVPSGAGLPSISWWDALGSALGTGTTSQGPLVDLLTASISGSSQCSAIPALVSDAAHAKMASAPEIVVAGPERGGPEAAAAVASCSAVADHLPSTVPLLLQQPVLAGLWRA